MTVEVEFETHKDGNIYIKGKATICPDGIVRFSASAGFTPDDLEQIAAKAREAESGPKDSEGRPMVAGRLYLVWERTSRSIYLDRFVQWSIGDRQDGGAIYQLVEKPNV